MKTTKEKKKPSRNKAKRQTKPRRFFSLFRRNKKKKLKKNKFYWHRDSSEQGRHPAKIYKKNRRKNKYHAVCFTQTKKKGRTELSNNINPNSQKKCYVKNTPVIAKSSTFGKRIKGFKVRGRKDKATVKRIQKKK